jgi:ribonuclease E
VNRTTHQSYVGNVYLGKVQNVLPSMEAAFVDIGKGRNAVLYAGEVNFDASSLEGQPKRIESALKPGQSVIVQVTKDPVGHKGARLTSQVSLPGRYLVYVPGASMTGISRKLPDTERTRLKHILKKVTPEHAGVIVRTAAEGAAEAELDRDITRLAAQWESIEKKAKTASAPALLYGEPDLTIRVVRDVFNEDFSKLIVSGDEGWEIIDEYVRYVAPHLADRLTRWDRDGETNADVFAEYRIDEQLAKALERKVWLPSGGSLVIDRTEAMTVIDVNTGKFTGQGGNLEETVTRNNLEAAEEIVRQLRLRDVGGIVVIDFIDMVLESNRELVLRRLLECLARDRTKHQVAEVTSLGLVQMTRKRVGAGLLEAFSQQCECCNGRGVIVTLETPAEPPHRASAGIAHRPVPSAPSPGGQANGTGNGGNGNGGNGGGSRNRDAAGQGGNARGGVQEAVTHDAVTRDALTQDTVTGAKPVDAGQDSQSGNGQAASAASGVDRVEDGQPGAAATAAVNPAASTNGTGRTRRSTSAGTAFATAVRVEDTPALVPVIPTAQDPALSGFITPSASDVATSDTAEASPVRRTRSGSALARVTVTPAAEPAVEPAVVEPAVEESAAVTPADADSPPDATLAAPASEVPASEVPASEVLASEAPVSEAPLEAVTAEGPAEAASAQSYPAEYPVVESLVVAFPAAEVAAVESPVSEAPAVVEFPAAVAAVEFPAAESAVVESLGEGSSAGAVAEHQDQELAAPMPTVEAADTLESTVITAQPTAVPAEPVPAEPVPAEPVPAEPVPAESALAGPVPAGPVLAESVPAEPVPAEPVPAEPVLTEPVPAESALAEPVPVEPVPAEPVLTEPVPAEPVLIESVPADPARTESALAEPVLPEPVPAEAHSEAEYEPQLPVDLATVQAEAADPAGPEPEAPAEAPAEADAMGSVPEAESEPVGDWNPWA